MKRRGGGNVVRGRFGAGRKARWTKASGYSTGLPKARRRKVGWLAFVPLWGGAALLGTAYGAGWLDGIWETDQVQTAAGTTTGEHASFSYCHIGGGYNCVVDGDTIRLKGEKIRVADIDAPETHDYRCSSEKELGERATRRLHDLLESGPITLRPIERDEDSYGRKLRVVLVNGKSVGDTLASEGLVRWYGSGRRSWC